MKLERALSYLKIVAILSSLIFTACLREQKEAPLAQRSGYVGCLDAVATGKDSIEVTVNMPSQATEVQVFRNNTLVGSVFPGDSQNNVFNDTLLPVQGEVYKYSCKAITPNEDLVGYNEPTVRTTPEDSPIFEGLKTVTIENNVHAKLTWKSPVSAGPKTVKYEVYANMNRATGSVTPNVDFTQEPIATVTAPATTYTITAGLGDKIPYVFSVLACTHNDICAGSEVYKTASTLDNGKPQTTGISNIETLSGGIRVTAPWSESMGETSKRVLYMGTTNSTNLADYTQIRAFNISSDNLKDQSFMQSMTSFEVVDSRIQENTLYYFALVDQDSNGNTSDVIPYQLQTYDLTPPNFMGITDISPNSLQPSTAMDITFPATATEGAPDNDPTGASSYIVEYTQTPYVDGSTAWPADPCTNGVRHATTFPANPGGVAGGSSVTITVNGLSPRTYYRFCVRAKDAYGNESGDLSSSVTIPVSTLDAAPPIFDGIQGLSGVTPGGIYKIKVDWNKASDLHSNVKYYQIKLWSNTPDSTSASDLKIINRSASNSAYDNGTFIENTIDFDYGQGTRVYVLVNACDDADTIPDGSINCTTYDDTLAMSIIPPDIEPPQNFTGISSATSTVSNGVVTVTWDEPDVWTPSGTPEHSDYFGFRIYNSVLNPSTSNYDLTLLDSCNCASPGNCINPTDLSCDVSNLNANRTYRLHVRAVDAAGNETQNNPQVSWEEVTVKDGIAPTFTPNLTGEWKVVDQFIKLNWSAATDNQYTGNIRYEIFRRQPGQDDFTPAEIANPTESPRATLTDVTTYDDIDSNYAVVGGGNYYYLICAKDEQNNRTCANSSLNVFLPDVRPPDILTELQSDKSTDTSNLLRLWDLSFKVTDNNTRLDRLDVKVYSTFTETPETPAEISANLDPDGNNSANRTDDSGTDYITISNLRGKAQQNGYVNYKVVVIDEYGNKSSKTVSYTFDARLTITSIAANKANKDLSKEVVVQGTGFSKGSENGTGIDTEILLGTTLCSNINVLAPTVLTCDTPTGIAAGLVNVTIRNPDNVQDTISGGFTFTDGSTFPHALCDTQPAQDALPFAEGLGSEAEPYVICNVGQFSNISSNTSSYFELGEHIDLTSVGQVANSFSGGINGNGYMLYNNTSSYITTMFGNSYLKNIVFFNGRALFITNLQGGTVSNISFIKTSFTSSSSYIQPFIANLVFTASPINIENIDIDFGETEALVSSTSTNFTNGIYRDTSMNSLGSGLLTLKNINIRGKIITSQTSNFSLSLFKGLTHVNVDNLNVDLNLHHNQSSRYFIVNFFDNIGVYGSSFNKTIPNQGIDGIRNLNINIESTGISSFRFAGNINFKENALAENININVTNNNTVSFNYYNASKVRLNRGVNIKNFTINTPPSSFPVADGILFSEYVEYDARTSGSLILVENFKSNLNISYPKFFIGKLVATEGPSPSSPDNMQPIKFSKIETLGPLVHIFDVTNAGSFTDLSVPAVELENIKINSTNLVNYGFSSDGGQSAAIISGITNYNSTSYIKGLDSTSYWLAPSVSPYIKLNNVLVVPHNTTNYLVSFLGDTGDAVVNATHEGLCNAPGSSGSFYLNDIAQLTDNPAHTTCSAFTAETEANLQDSTPGNVFESAGWDFTNVWKWPDGGGYPELR